MNNEMLNSIEEARVLFNGESAGRLWRAEGKFHFQYDAVYLNKPNAIPFSATLPLRAQVFTENYLFPFWDGLIPEGWLLSMALDRWKLNRTDRWQLLMATGRNTIGAVYVEPVLPAEQPLGAI